jgi:C-terminal peptidase prc
MIARTFALASASVLVLLGSAPALLGTQQGDLSGLIAGEIASAGQRDVPSLWRRAAELRDADALGEKGELDRTLDDWLAKKKELVPQAALLLAATRLLGPTPEATRLAEAVTPLVDGPDAPLAAAAAQLLSDPAFKALAPARRDELANTMLARADDKALAPAVRLAFAKAAFRTGGGKERLKANRILRNFLDSEDPELKAEGALATAELGAGVIEGELRDTLEQLSNDRVKADLLKRAENASGQLPEVKELLTVLQMIKKRHIDGARVSQDELFDAAIDGMLGYMDQHSSLLPSEQYAKFYGELEAEYGGIGAYVNEDPDDGLFTIVRPIYSGPAYRMGLMTEDKIVRIGDWPTLGQKVDEIIKHLKGKPETPADLYIWRRGMDPSLIERPTADMKVTVLREQVRIPPGTYQMLPGGVGLLQLDDFSQVAMEEAKKWIQEMLGLGMKSLVLDLRFNGGGLLPEAQKVAELFLPPGVDVVSTVEADDGSGDPPKNTLKTGQGRQVLPPDMPLVVLVGGGTASAAEIVSGALQDHHRAQLVGKTTYGKGSVQQLIPVPGMPEDKYEDENGNNMRDPWEKLTLDNNGNGEMDYAPRVKLTIAKYLLPSGRWIHRDIDRKTGVVRSEGGVKPDVEIDSPSIEGWRLLEQRRIRPMLKKHVDETYEKNRELYNALALNDKKRTDLYPGFDGLMKGLGTTLPPEDVRRVLRYEVRRRVQDDRGAAFPIGDFVEDVQLQKAIEVALEPLGKKPSDVDDFGLVFDLPKGEANPPLTLARGEEKDLSRALQEARQGGKPLTGEQFDRLIEILGTIDPANPVKKN